MSIKKRNFLQHLLTDSSDVSSKRFISLVGFALLAIAFTINIFRDISMKDFVWDGMLWIVLGGLGLTVAEKFGYSKRFKRNSQTASEQDDESNDDDVSSKPTHSGQLDLSDDEEEVKKTKKSNIDDL